MNGRVYIKIVSEFIQTLRPVLYTQRGEVFSMDNVEDISKLGDSPDKDLEFAAICSTNRQQTELKIIWVKVDHEAETCDCGGKMSKLRRSGISGRSVDLEGKPVGFDPREQKEDEQVLESLFSMFQTSLTAVKPVSKGEIIPE